MSEFLKIEDGKTYFITMTIVDWVDLFTRECYVNILIDSVKYCQNNKGLEVYSYVIMPMKNITMLENITTHGRHVRVNGYYYSYDIYDRLRGVNYENNLLTSAISYDKNKKTINSGANRIKEIYEDASGNVVKVVDNGGTITYKYGAHNKLVETDANGSVISIIYNVQLNKIELHEPNAGVTQYDYNAFGDLIAQVDANGNTFFFHYDAIGRLIKKAKTNEEYLYSYNNSPGLGKNNKLAEELYKVNNTEVHRINYSHTAEGLVSAVIEVIKGTTTYATSYHYDTYLRLSRIDYPNITVGYGYDATNNLVELFDGNSNLLWRKNATFTDGRTNQFELGNGFVTELSFNADAQLQNIMSTKQGFPNAINLGYNFNLLTGNLEDRYFDDISKSEKFYYDNLDRLTSIIYWNNGNPNSAFDNKYYSYANNGNIATINNGGLLTQDLTYHNTKINAVTKHKYESSLTPVRVPQASVDNHTYTYNSIGKLATINQDVLDYELTYGVYEQRIEAVKKEYGQVVYTKQYINSASMETKNGEELTYLYAEGQPFAIHKKTVDDEMMYYLHLDHLGSIMSITDQSGIVVEARSYDAWGRPQDPNTWSYQLTPFGALNITDRGYTFHEHLIEFSLINMNGRMYDPVLGRVISPDNLVPEPDKTQAYNRYTYCYNNPLKYTDPDGNEPITVAILIGVAIGGYAGGKIADAKGYDFNDWQMYAYIAGGAAVGGASGAVAAGVATSGVIGAKTAAIAYGSYYNSVGMHMVSQGQSSVSISFGLGSYNFTNNEWNGIWNWGANSALENIGYSLGALTNLSDLASIVDEFTLWEDKLAKKCADYMDKWEKENPNAVVDPYTVGRNGGRSYPSYFSKNPKILGTKQDYMGMVDNWSWKEYAGYLHDAEYIAKGIEKGAKYLLGSYRTYGADIRLASRTLFLGLKHFSPFEITGGVMQLGINAQKIPYGWMIR